MLGAASGKQGGRKSTSKYLAVMAANEWERQYGSVQSHLESVHEKYKQVLCPQQNCKDNL